MLRQVRHLNLELCKVQEKILLSPRHETPREKEQLEMKATNLEAEINRTSPPRQRVTKPNVAAQPPKPPPSRSRSPGQVQSGRSASPELNRRLDQLGINGKINWTDAKAGWSARHASPGLGGSRSRPQHAAGDLSVEPPPASNSWLRDRVSESMHQVWCCLVENNSCRLYSLTLTEALCVQASTVRSPSPQVSDFKRAKQAAHVKQLTNELSSVNQSIEQEQLSTPRSEQMKKLKLKAAEIEAQLRRVSPPRQRPPVSSAPLETTPERPAADESDEECAWVSPESSSGRQGSDLMAAKMARQRAQQDHSPSSPADPHSPGSPPEAFARTPPPETANQVHKKQVVCIASSTAELVSEFH